MPCLWTCIYIIWSVVCAFGNLPSSKGSDYVYDLLQWNSSGDNHLLNAIIISVFTFLASVCVHLLLIFMKKCILHWKIQHELWIDIDIDADADVDIDIDDQQPLDNSELIPLHDTYNK